MIIIIDYGMGNLGSIINIFKKIGVTAVASSSPDEIARASKLILPGVGAFDTGMKNLGESGLLDLLHEKVIEQKTPVLGVCLGMQLLGQSSEEGSLSGLGWIAAKTVKFRLDPSSQFKIPHMGWAYVTSTRPNRLFSDMPYKARFYFVHSYHFVCDDLSDVIATADHGITFCAAINRGNIWGAQFHPEKSHKFGMLLCKNFAEL